MRLEWVIATAIGVFVLVRFRDKLGLEDLFCKLGLRRVSGHPCEGEALPPEEVPSDYQEREPVYPVSPLRPPAPSPQRPQPELEPEPEPEPEYYGPELADETGVPWAPDPPADTPEFPGEWAISNETPDTYTGYGTGYRTAVARFAPGATKPGGLPWPYDVDYFEWKIYIPRTIDNRYAFMDGETMRAIRTLVRSGVSRDFAKQRLDALIAKLATRPNDMGTVGWLYRPVDEFWTSIMVIPIAIAEGGGPDVQQVLWSRFRDFVYRGFALDPRLVYNTVLYHWWRNNVQNEAPPGWKSQGWSQIESLDNWRFMRAESEAA